MVKRSLTVVVLAGSLALGCGDGGDGRRPPLAAGTGGDGAGAAAGSLSVFITDAPPTLEDLAVVSISVDRIEALGPEGATALLPETTEGQQDLTVDLVPLKGGARTAIARGAVPPGTYRLRLTLSRAAVHMAEPGVPAARTVYDTDNGLLRLEGGVVPAGADDGLRRYEVEVPGGDGVEVEADEDVDVLVDFDLAGSLEAEGDPDAPTAIVMTPVMRLRVLPPPGPRPGPRPGSLRGVVRGQGGEPGGAPGDDAALEHALVTLLDADAGLVHARTRTDAQGVFVIEGVQGGPWDLQVEQDGFDTFRAEDLVVEGTTTRDVLLTPAAAD